MDNRPIGIFDSGVGGLTVAKEVIKALPGEDIIYFGDTARVPYGAKSKEAICKFSAQVTNFLITKGVKIIIIACGTSSTNSYDYLTGKFPIPFIEMASAGADACLESTDNNIVGVIGTEATVRSGIHAKLMREHSPNIEVYTKACPLFVHLAEEGWTNNDVTRITAELYLRELLDKKIDSLLLGCTHYPLLTECIRNVAGSVKLVDPAITAAAKTKEFLTKRSMLNQNGKQSHMFYVSDNTNKFGKICRLALEREYEATEIDIEKY